MSPEDKRERVPNFVKIEGFLDEDTCKHLIDYINSRSSDSDESAHKMMGGRTFISSASALMDSFGSGSKVVRDLNEFLLDEKFAKFLHAKLGMKFDGMRKTTLFNKRYEKDSILGRIKKLGEPQKLRKAGLKLVVGEILYRSVLYFRWALVRLRAKVSGVRPYELLFDYSVSSNGYENEIHRDTDGRHLVFLIYLNSKKGGDGGEFVFHHPKNDNAKFFNPQPNENEAPIYEIIPPVAGTLVAFENSDWAYHSVPKMRNWEEGRYFIYGAMTFLDDAVRKGSTSRLPSELSLYY